MNDNDRAQWIDNDEGLYDWWRSSGLPKREFIRTNRAEIDAAITPVVEGDKPAHHLKYTVVKFSELGPDLNLSAEHHIAKAEAAKAAADRLAQTEVPTDPTSGSASDTEGKA